MPNVAPAGASVYLVQVGDTTFLRRARTDLLLRGAVSDITDEMDRVSHVLAPKGETKELSRSIDKDSVKNTPFGFRGNVTLPSVPRHNIFVYRGTGEFGPLHRRIWARGGEFMYFRLHGRVYRLRSIAGQKPQPFMREAFNLVDRMYVPIRIEQLRLQIQRAYEGGIGKGRDLPGLG